MVPLTPAWTELRYHAPQSALWRTKARFVAVAAGRGSGKSEIARRRVVRMLNVQKPWPDPSYFYALPTYAQAKDKHWEKIKALVPRHWISAIRESRMVIETIYGSKLSLIGLDKAYRAEGEQYDGGIIDECFVAGTLVDTPCGAVPIEKIKPGDHVYCAAGVGTVTATKQRRKPAIAVVRSQNYTFVCSLNHPFLTEVGWVAAERLTKGDRLVNSQEAMQTMQAVVPPEGQAERLLRSVLRNEGRASEARRQGRDQRQGCEAMAVAELEASQTRACQNSRAEPDGRPGGADEGIADSAGDWAPTSGARRQRAAAAGASVAATQASGQALGCRVLCSDRTHQDSGKTVSLHHRPGLRRSDDRGRDRRREPSRDEEARCEKGPVLEAERVESVEIHQSGSAEFNRHSGGEDQVTLYDLTVDEHPSFSVNGVLVHNCSDVKPKTFDLTFIPALTHRNGWCWRIGVPKRMGIGAREFHNACINWGMSGDEYASFEWPSTDILPAEEMAKRREGMPERDFNEQFMASWENATGVVYYAYDPNESRCTWTYRPDLPIFVGSDFNVDPMAWVLLQAQGQTLFAFDEIWLKNTNTQRTLDELARRYGTHAGGWRFFGDASSRSRKTSASSTDYMQILNDKRFQGAKLWYPEANPSVVDRHAAVNWALKSASGKRTLFVDGRCLHLINDLKYLSYLEGSREPDLRDPEAGHITDALGYVIHYVKPMRLEGPVAVPQVMTM